jgi:hypothetical protein
MPWEPGGLGRRAFFHESHGEFHGRFDFGDPRLTVWGVTTNNLARPGVNGLGQAGLGVARCGEAWFFNPFGGRA